MTNHHEETPRTNDPVPIPQENVPCSSPNRKCEHRRESAESSAFDNLLKQNEAYYRKESRLLAIVAARIGVPKAEIEDVVEEGWLRAVEHRDQFEGEAMEWRLHCLMEKVIHDKAVDLLRHLDSCPCQSLSEEDTEPSDEVVAKRVERAELHEWLEALLEEESVDNEVSVQLLRAHFFQEIPVSALAQQFGMTLDAVEGRMRRLLNKIRQRLKDFFSSKLKPDFNLASRREKLS